MSIGNDNDMVLTKMWIFWGSDDDDDDEDDDDDDDDDYISYQ